MAGPLPGDWLDTTVRIEMHGGGVDSIVGSITGHNEGGCFITRMLPEGDNPEPIARSFFYPWTSIRSVMLMEDPRGPGPSMGMA